MTFLIVLRLILYKPFRKIQELLSESQGQNSLIDFKTERDSEETMIKITVKVIFLTSNAETR